MQRELRKYERQQVICQVPKQTNKWQTPWDSESLFLQRNSINNAIEKSNKQKRKVYVRAIGANTEDQLLEETSKIRENHSKFSYEGLITYSRTVLILRPLQLTTNLTVIWISALHVSMKIYKNSYESKCTEKFKQQTINIVQINCGSLSSSGF